MTQSNKNAWLAIVALSMSVVAGCASHSDVEGSFDRQFTVNGPVSLELTSGKGDVHITSGPPGEVRIHGDVSVKAWSLESARHRVQQMEANPPLSQEGSLIRIGGGKQRELDVDYTIVVPHDTQLRSMAGSGDLEVQGIEGPANFTSGSGDVHASEINKDVQIVSGSGDVSLSQVKGQVQVNTGSGDVSLETIGGQIRIQTGSGSIEITNPAQASEASTGSGDVTIKGTVGDIRVRTASGDVDVEGNPGESNYWDFHTASGEVVLHVPSNASFRLYARSKSGDIDAAIPIMMEGTAAKHELRARIGDGKARVEIQTSSGDISLH